MEIKNFNSGLLKETAKLCRQNLVLDSMPDFLFEEKTLSDPDYNPDLTFVAFEEGRVEGFIQGVVRNRKDGKTGYIKLLCVSRDFRRKGFAAQLYGKAEESFVEQGVKIIRVGESYPNYLTPGIDPFYTAGVCFFEEQGFVKFNDTSNLSAELASSDFDTSKEEKLLVGENFFVKRAEQKDRQKTLEWVDKNFEGWNAEVTAAFNNNPVSLFIAGKAGSVLAFSAYEANNKGTGWFGPMGTDKEARGKGLGAVLLKKTLSAMKHEGFTKAIIPWVGPIPFYMKTVNASVSRVFWRYEKKLP